MWSYDKAKREFDSLRNYITLIEEYQVNSLETFIIHRYAIYNSISKVLKSVREEQETLKFLIDIDMDKINHNFIKNTVLSSPRDPLHEILRKGYQIKTRPQRRNR